MGKPVVSKESDLGALGVRIVDGIVEDHLGFIFRPRERRDLGIDGEIELVDRDETETRTASGRLVAVQIKCGRSHFIEAEGDAFVYRGKLKHLEYWSDFSLPVIVALCDPDTRAAYWVEVTQSAVTRLEKDWKILVPKTNELSSSRYKIDSIGKRNPISDVIDLCVQAWFHSSFSERVEFCGGFAMPRDYHWYRHLIDVGQEQIMVHWLYARYGRFERKEIEDVLKYLPGNLKYYGKKLILGLVAESADAFSSSADGRELLASESAVEAVNLIFDRSVPRIGKLVGPNIIEIEYHKGTAIYSEDLDGNWLG
ncbi:DUF4365 domain-containing protein [Agrobacterium sp. CG160-95]